MPLDLRTNVNVLLVCSRNQWRSPTAESIWRGSPGVSVRSAGTASSARRKLSFPDLDWADMIFVMEDKHKRRILDLSGEHSSSIIVLDIPDEYRYMDDELVELLAQPVEHHIARFREAREAQLERFT